MPGGGYVGGCGDVDGDGNVDGDGGDIYGNVAGGDDNAGGGDDDDDDQDRSAGPPIHLACLVIIVMNTGGKFLNIFWMLPKTNMIFIKIRKCDHEDSPAVNVGDNLIH